MRAWSVKKKLLVICVAAVAALALFAGVAAAAGNGTGDGSGRCEGECLEGEGRGNGTGHGPGIMKGHRQEIDTLIADTLGISTDELHDELRDGKTLSQLAEEKGVSADTLAEAITARIYELIDQAVEEGKLDADTAENIKPKVPERVTDMMENFRPRGQGPDGQCQDGDGGVHRGPRPDAEEASPGDRSPSDAPGKGNGSGNRQEGVAS